MSSAASPTIDAERPPRSNICSTVDFAAMVQYIMKRRRLPLFVQVGRPIIKFLGPDPLFRRLARARTNLAFYASHRHRVTKAGCRMSIDRNLSNFPIRHFVCAPELKRCRSRLDVEAARQCRRNERRGDFLMNLCDALAEQVFDQRKDWTGVALQESAYRGKVPVDVVFSPTERSFNTIFMSEAAYRQPLVTARKSSTRCEFSVNQNHLDGLDCEARADREGDEVVDRRDVVNV